MRRLIKQISILLIAFVIVIGVVSTTQSQSSDNSNPALFAGHEIAPSAIMWSGPGHFVQELLGYIPSGYTVQPNFRQASTSTATANSTISSSDVADLFVNFDFDTGGKSVYLVYTTNGSAPNKSNGTVVNAVFSNYWEPNRTWRAAVSAQVAGTVVNYVFYISDNSLANGWGRISGTIVDRNASQYQTGWSETDNAYFTYTVMSGSPTPIAVIDAKALWLDQATIGWNGTAGSSYKLLYDPDGGVASNAETNVCTFPNPATACYVDLTASGTVSGYPKNPNASGLTRLLLPGSVTTADVKQLLKGQVAVASYNSGGTRLDATRAQIQSILDALYAANAKNAPLGVTYSGSVPTLKLWAPTAKSVTVRRFADATTTTFTTHPMALDDASGVWTVTGDGSWDRHYYLLDVELYVPSVDQIVHNVVSDPYAITLSADSADTADPRSQFVNLDDADLKPTGWDSLSKPTLAAPEDIVVYEVHIRDFSINDETVTNSAERGTYRAFTYDGTGPNPNTTLSDGMDHLLQLQEAGLTHVHLLPTFDIASVPEDSVPRSVTPNPTGFGRSAQDQQTAVDGARATDGFNWGYDPYHYGAPEGSYSTNSADGTQRILEFREMVQALNQNDLRVVMDVVYNHTAAAGQDDKSVLDKIVPGYYYRYDTNGNAYNSSCCADTAAEYEMMEDLMIDTLVRWATAYKVDGFRFDLMNLHTRQNAINAQAAVQAVDPDIYVYGEGWDFGSAAAKGLTTCPDCYAKQSNMAGTGIGTFNDRLRDAAHGGYDTDSTQIRRQGFTNGLSYDWNGYCYNNRELSDLYAKTDILRSALRGSGTDWNGQGNPYTDDPQESVPYVSKHDNETLFDQNVFKLPGGDGSGLPGWCGTGIPFTSMSDRVRVQNLGLDVVALAQGIPFFHMGSDILRSKSLDRNSYDSSDWFNRVDWSYNDATYSNNFGQGLPPNWDNSSRWTIMTPLLNNTSFDPASADAQAGAAHLREMLRIRQSSPLFRLQTEADVNARVTFLNADNDPAGVIVMALSDEPTPDLDASYETILVFINADKSAHAIVVDGANGFALHPVHVDAVDADVVVQSADFNDTTDTFTIPARTTAVFVSSETIELPSTIDWVGKLYPRGGVANYIDEGSFTPSGFDVYVRVYEPGVTEPAGAPTGIACTLHWGIGGGVWSDLPMTWNAQQGNDDEFKATIPQATINALSPGNYGFTAYCQKSGETGKKWKVDEYDIDGNPADDDQGDGLITIVPSADSSPEQPGSVFVHLFEWRWADIEKECTYLAEKGYRAVQVSPPNEHLVPTADQGGQVDSDFPWWARYQPVTHDTAAFTSRSGTLAEFQSMVTTCNNLGVGIIVDAVINHTADIEVGSPPAGTAGTQYESSAIGRFYGTQYQSDDFHTDCSISSYADREQVQRCKLTGLPDLNTGKSDVQTELHTYLQALINMGVAGFRIDGSKHIAAHEIATILDGLTGDFTVFQEVIDLDPSERVRDWEYTPNGDVTEFAWSQAMGDKFNPVQRVDQRSGDAAVRQHDGESFCRYLCGQSRQPARPRPRWQLCRRSP
ncbi:MAG: pullulanase-type alpha-1,6-glucosidase [Anaerolineae bacterium]|nr:pullulanase-type alpha-1,6-glucosidase [Anaerolineae bacterium]